MINRFPNFSFQKFSATLYAAELGKLAGVSTCLSRVVTPENLRVGHNKLPIFLDNLPSTKLMHTEVNVKSMM